MPATFARAVALAAFALALPAHAQGPAIVGADAVQLEPVNQTSLAIGRFVTLNEAVVPALLPSHVTRIAVEVGDSVGEGDALAVLDVDRLALEVQRAEANLAAAEARAKAAGRRLERAEALRESSAFSEAHLDDARGEAEDSAAQVRAATAAFNLARTDFRHGTVRAPFDGVVEVRHVDLGEAVQPGTPVATLVSDSALEVEADVPSRRVPALVPGSEVAITLADGAALQARVRAVGAVENPRTRTRRVRFVPVLPGDRTRPAVGESVELHIPISAGGQVATVSKDAILQRQGISLVYAIVDGVAQIRPVELGDAVGDRFIVLAGVAAGEMVVVRGNERLRPGQPVTVGPPPPPEGAAAAAPEAPE